MQLKKEIRKLNIIEMLKQEEVRISRELSGIRNALSALNGHSLSSDSPVQKTARCLRPLVYESVKHRNCGGLQNGKSKEFPASSYEHA
jgi:hypothetical protein